MLFLKLIPDATKYFRLLNETIINLPEKLFPFKYIVNPSEIQTNLEQDCLISRTIHMLPSHCNLYILLLFGLVYYSGTASTIVVGEGEKYSTVQSGIQAARTGDIVFIRKGWYPVSLLKINKGISLKGEGFPILDGQLKEDVIVITASGVSIEGLDIRNSPSGSLKEYAGIRCSDCRNVTVKNCRLDGNFFAIYLANVEGGLIEHNVIKGKNNETASGNGIHSWKSKNLHIGNNTVTGHRDGIYLEFTKFSLINGNYCEGNYRYGLHFMFSDNDSYIGNHFRNNGAGVAVMYTRYVEMQYNLFEYNRGSSSFGLLLKDISRSVIRNNRFEQNSTGIYLEGSSDVRILQNDFISNGWGIRIMADCVQDTFQLNNLIGNTFDMATNGTLNKNYFAQNYWDKYSGYDLDKNGTGDIPYHPVSLFSQINEQVPFSIMLYRSFLVGLLDQAERAIPTLNGIEIVDETPEMKPIKLKF